MSQKLPVNNFEWIKEPSQFNEDFIKIYNPLATEGVGGGWGVSVEPQLVCFCSFLIFSKFWQVVDPMKLLILGDLFARLFGLVFLHLFCEKMRVGVHRSPPR